MTIIEPQAAAFSVDSYFSAAAKSLTNPDRRALAAVDKKLGELNRLAARFATPRMNQEHALDMEIYQLEAQLAENPTEEAALALHNLIARKQQAQLSSASIGSALERKQRATVEELTSIAIKLIDEAETAFNAAADKHRAANADGDFSSDLALFNARAAATAAAFAEKRRWVREENAAAAFLLLELGS